MAALSAGAAHRPVPHLPRIRRPPAHALARRTERAGILRHQQLLRAVRLPADPRVQRQWPAARAGAQLPRQAPGQSLPVAPGLTGADGTGAAGHRHARHPARRRQGDRALRGLRHQRGSRRPAPRDAGALHGQRRTAAQPAAATVHAAGLEPLLPELQPPAVVGVHAVLLLPVLPAARATADGLAPQELGAGGGGPAVPAAAVVGDPAAGVRHAGHRPAAPQSVAAPAGIRRRDPALRAVSTARRGRAAAGRPAGSGRSSPGSSRARCCSPAGC